VVAAVAEVAARQKPVVTLADVLACGLSRPGVQHWIRTGRLHPRYPGVYAFGRADLSREGAWLAAVEACGPGAVLPHVSAAALLKLRATSAHEVHVTIPAGRPLLRLPGVRCHRAALAPQDVIEEEGIRVTSVARTLLDLASVLSPPALERAAKQAVIERAFNMREIEGLLSRSRGRRGIRRLREVLARGDLSADDVPLSTLEARFATLCAESGLPKPEINRYILLGDEYHLVDFLWRRERVVVETDGSRYHSTGWQRDRDVRRDELLGRHGYGHARFTDCDIEQRHQEAIRTVRTLLKR
jgi:very-short-patch-repair endonuclease